MQANTKKTPVKLGQSIKSQAAELGFDAAGIAQTEDPIDPAGYLQQWLNREYQADMHWITRTADLRTDPALKLPGIRSVVVVARNYYSPRPPQNEASARIASYAWGRDYHKVLKKPLIALAKFIEDLEPGTKTYASIDTGPVLERAWAQRAGIGAIGKNGLILRRDIGSWFFLGTILTTLELEPDKPTEDLCGTCTLCIDSCPTQAIVEPRVVDSNRCISYQTIENREEIPEALHEQQGDWVFGCDVCQDVCPWNRFATQTTETDFLPREGHANPRAKNLLELDEETFNQEFAGTPIRRAKYAGMMRNASIALKNAQPTRAD